MMIIVEFEADLRSYVPVFALQLLQFYHFLATKALRAVRVGLKASDKLLPLMRCHAASRLNWSLRTSFAWIWRWSLNLDGHIYLLVRLLDDFLARLINQISIASLELLRLRTERMPIVAGASSCSLSVVSTSPCRDAWVVLGRHGLLSLLI